jgi:hypothetical protein
MNALTPDSLLTLPVDDLVTLSSETLCYLHHDAIAHLAAAHARLDHLKQVLDAKYAARAQALRHALGENTRTVQFDEDGLRITAHWPTTVEWNQTALAEIVTRIAASEGDPTQYVDLTYHVPATRFNAWPDSLQASFAKARTPHTGPPEFQLTFIHTGGAP